MENIVKSFFIMYIPEVPTLLKCFIRAIVMTVLNSVTHQGIIYAFARLALELRRPES